MRERKTLVRLLRSRREAHRRYIPTIPGRMLGYQHKHGTSDGRFEALFEYKRLDHRAKIVCLSCNNGWMNDLENRARPALTEMIAGSGVSCLLISNGRWRPGPRKPRCAWRKPSQRPRKLSQPTTTALSTRTRGDLRTTSSFGPGAIWAKLRSGFPIARGRFGSS